MKMKKSVDYQVIKFILSGILFLGGLLVSSHTALSFVLLLLSYLIVGYDVIWKALKNIIHGELFDESFLMTIATMGAFAIQEFAEGVAVMFFFQLGEYISDKAVENSKKQVSSLLDLRSDTVWMKVDNEYQKVDPEHVSIGSIIMVHAGERIPLDGIVVDGSSTLDTSSLTGESMPCFVEKGSRVLSGSINQNGSLLIETTTTYQNSTVSKILSLIQDATLKKTKTEKFITQFSKVYTPIVVLLAVLFVVVPVAFFQGDFSTWLYRALVFLVISCPCALVISIPLGFFCGIGACSKNGILVKGSNELERLGKIKTFVFDKTGTLTKGNFAIVEIHPYQEEDQNLLLEMAVYGEYYSLHPVGMVIKELYDGKISEKKIKNYKEVAGYGVRVTVAGKNVLLGKRELLLDEGIDIPACSTVGTVIHVSADGKYLGHFVIADELKEDSYALFQQLRTLGITNFIVLSGDNESIVSDVSTKLGITSFYANLLPQDKVEKMEQIQRQGNHDVAFVGDGMNDAPVLLSSDLGISMGGIGTDAAIEASDIVLMDDHLEKIATGIRISRKTHRIVYQNIVFAIAVKVIILILGAFGFTSIWAAVFSDVGVTILAVLNALRIFYHRY